MKRLLLALVFCLAPGLRLQAEHVEPPATFRIISACGSYGGLFYDTGSGIHRIAVGLNINQALSAPLVCPAEPVLEIYRLIPPPPDAPPKTPPSRQIVASVRLPEKPAGSIVVTFPHSKSPTGPILQAHVVPGSPELHHAGSLMVVNFSSFTAGVALDEHQTTIAPGAIDVVKTGTGRVLVQVAVDKRGNWAKAFRGERRIAPQLRGYVFVFNYMVDPDYGAADVPPPATVKTFFEVSPETLDVAKK